MVQLLLVFQVFASTVSWSADLSPTSRINNRDGLRYIWIPPGVYAMGCSPGDHQCFLWEPSSHVVKIAQGFWIGETEVTQEAYQHVTGTNPSRYRGLGLPVEQINWDNARVWVANS